MFKKDNFVDLEVDLEDLRLGILQDEVSSKINDFKERPTMLWNQLRLSKPVLETLLLTIEKQIPKKTTPIQCEELEYMCECGYKYTYSFKPNYCCYCGQKLNWD